MQFYPWRQTPLNVNSLERSCEEHYEYNIKKIDESLTSPRHLNEIIIAKIYVLLFRPTGLPQNEQCTQVYKNTRIQSMTQQTYFLRFQFQLKTDN